MDGPRQLTRQERVVDGHQPVLAAGPAWHSSGEHAMAAVLDPPRGHVVRHWRWPSRTAWVKQEDILQSAEVANEEQAVD